MVGIFLKGQYYFIQEFDDVLDGYFYLQESLFLLAEVEQFVDEFPHAVCIFMNAQQATIQRTL